MRFKYNPWVSTVALLLLATILVLLCTGCATEAEATEPVEIGRFSVEFAGSGFPHLGGLYVITDSQTGVQYLFVDKVDSGGLVKMEG